MLIVKIVYVLLCIYAFKKIVAFVKYRNRCKISRQKAEQALADRNETEYEFEDSKVSR
jgi:hypothetical protein